MMAFFVLLLLTSLAAQVLQPLVPPIAALHGARILLFPAVLAYGSLALPYPLVLALAFATGICWDLLTLQVVTLSAETAMRLSGPLVEISAGTHVMLFGVLCTIIHGLRPLFLRGRWELHVLVSGLSTAGLLVVEYLLISLKRRGFEMTPVIWWRIAAPAVGSMLLAPFVFGVFHLAAHLCGFPVREQPREREAHALRAI